MVFITPLDLSASPTAPLPYLEVVPTVIDARPPPHQCKVHACRLIYELIRSESVAIRFLTFRILHMEHIE